MLEITPRSLVTNASMVIFVNPLHSAEALRFPSTFSVPVRGLGTIHSLIVQAIRNPQCGYEFIGYSDGDYGIIYAKLNEPKMAS